MDVFKKINNIMFDAGGPILLLVIIGIPILLIAGIVIIVIVVIRLIIKARKKRIEAERIAQENSGNNIDPK